MENMRGEIITIIKQWHATLKMAEKGNKMKCKYSDIKAIYDWCEKYADEEARQLIGTQPSTHIIAYFTPSNANWAYQVGIVNYKGNAYEVVLVFGEVKAVRLCQIPSYNTATLNDRRY